MKIIIEIPDDYCMDWIKEQYCPCLSLDMGNKCDLFNVELDEEWLYEEDFEKFNYKADEQTIETRLIFKCEQCKKLKFLEDVADRKEY